MAEPVITVFEGDDRQEIRINGQDPTFTLAFDAIRAAAVTEIDDLALDFLEIAAAVFAADSGFKRGGPTRPRMGEDWRREFRFRIPVRRSEIWSKPEITDALIAVAEFLTEDSMAFEFADAEPAIPIDPYFDLDTSGATYKADEVILFSGGLDSFAGALETLSASTERVILVTHRSAQKVIPRQVELGEILKKRFGSQVMHLQVQARRKGQQGRDDTQRSRTLLFTALGQAVARTFGARRLSLFENGVISHNLPISQQIVGTMATRTTHPLGLKLMNDLLGLIWPGGPSIRNRYEWLTKTDVVRRVAEYGAARDIPRTVSCTSIREQTSRHTHCGACTQCLDRRFAILAAGQAEHDKAEDYKTDILFGPRDTTRSRTFALEWTRHAIRVGQLDRTSALTEFGQEISRIVSGNPTLSSREALDRVLDLHRRHSRAVQDVIESATVTQAGALARQALPRTSLLVLHLSQAGPECAAPSRRFGDLFRPAKLNDVEEVDMVPDPSALLRVAFFEDENHVLAVEGLGRVEGMPARVAHELKPQFDVDRAAGLKPDDHRYVEQHRLAHRTGQTADAARQSVRRCRQTLASFFEDVHGEPPPHDLLIESPRDPATRGYRLDPTMIPISRDRVD
ncbi:hypothetical protein [Pelagovum pacificum]|uniref:7-cyano-7-deazaguanine synthase n=1 Tax=Pelagovum pacificum TaxID=2588711 RepID=A0A5C5G7Q4_9RHOB|nr:hypothetical protein [Pelagovum pacificum]QQA41512.1 hypothetical protein I8N54_11810 [Pelagovum pacificum]TNY30793.1 hypothetical protein FHY64_16885 [Pelagovum pacificum]